MFKTAHLKVFHLKILIFEIFCFYFVDWGWHLGRCVTLERWSSVVLKSRIIPFEIWLTRFLEHKKKVDGRLTSYSWAPLIIQYTVFSLFGVQVNQVATKIPVFCRKRTHPVGTEVWSWKEWSWKDWSWKDWSRKDWNDSSTSYRFQHKTFQLLNSLQLQASYQRVRSKWKTARFKGHATRAKVISRAYRLLQNEVENREVKKFLDGKIWSFVFKLVSFCSSWNVLNEVAKFQLQVFQLNIGISNKKVSTSPFPFHF